MKISGKKSIPSPSVRYEASFFYRKIKILTTSEILIVIDWLNLPSKYCEEKNRRQMFLSK